MALSAPERDNPADINFEELQRARLSRIGVIDVGSNSVRLVVFDGMARSPAYFYNEKVLCALGAGLSETGCLSPEGRVRALKALNRFTSLSAGMELSGMIVVATAAVRDAVDGPDFCEQVERETGLQIHVASGAEEARLSAKGVLLGWPSAAGLVSDMGGSSMELARLSGGEITDCETAPLGPLKLADVEAGEVRHNFIQNQIDKLRETVPGGTFRLFLVGGSWRAIARLDIERTGYPLTVLHGYSPPVEQLLETIRWIPEQNLQDLSRLTRTSMARLSLVPTAAPVLEALIRSIEPERIAISAYGLREGVLFGQMPKKMRRQDPLVEGCRHLETLSARLSGFGAILFKWLMPLYAESAPVDLRLVEAACLLHDVNWRGHPDYRAELCFASITRANIGGLNHAERVFLGLALLHRYKANAPEDLIRSYEAIMEPGWSDHAAVLGRAMRLGAMLSGSVSDILENTKLELGDGVLTLVLRGAACDCAGESVDQRLKSLAARLNLRPEITLLP